jgi:hypothetical protein
MKFMGNVIAKCDDVTATAAVGPSFDPTSSDARQLHPYRHISACSALRLLHNFALKSIPI